MKSIDRGFTLCCRPEIHSTGEISRASRIPAPILGALLLLIIAHPASADVSSAREPGIWQKHEHSFGFLGFTSTYSCDGLADKLKLLLMAAGARGDVKAQPGACAAGFGSPDKFARAQLTFYTLAPSGTPALGAAADSKPVEGAWQLVSLSDRHPRDLATGDCELVDQFRTELLPMFSTRNLENHTTCVPHQESGSVIALRFESFTAVLPHPEPDGAKAPPAHGPGD